MVNDDGKGSEFPPPAPPAPPAPRGLQGSGRPLNHTPSSMLAPGLEQLAVRQVPVMRLVLDTVPKPEGIDPRTLLGGARTLLYGIAAPELGATLNPKEVERAERAIALIFLALASNRGRELPPEIEEGAG